MNSPLFIFFLQGQQMLGVTGVAQIQEAPDTVTGVAGPPLAGIGGITETPDVLAGTGITAPGLPPGFVQEAPDTLAATGKVDVKGQAAIQEVPDVVVVPPSQPGLPAGDDYKARRRLRRALRPDPFERYTDDPGQLPLVARELAGYPPAMPIRPPHPRDLPGGISPMQATATDVMARMLGTPPSTPPSNRLLKKPVL
jgi:hypothetical protein